MNAITSTVPAANDSIPLRIEHELDRHALGRRTGAHAGIGEHVAGHEGSAIDQVGLATAGLAPAVENLRSRSRMLDGARLRSVGEQLELEKRRPADQLLGPLRILDAGQLDDDLVRALRLHGRLGDTELVDPVADDLEGLLLHVVTDAL